MYSVALVQNQSEMSHYGYADARPLLTGYDYRMFTGDDIADLSDVLAARQVDAVVFGSNALNDRDILSELCNAEFAGVLGDYLETGRGVLCLQQVGLAMRKGPSLDLLPAPLGSIRPVVRPAGESASSTGVLAVSDDAPAHVVLSYPRSVDLASVQAHACAFRSLPGLYWHYWDQVDLRSWDQVVADTAAAVHRPLVLAAKESGPWRAVVSALPLDWQHHADLFRNVLVYVIEGRHNLALLDTDDGGDLAFDYVRHSLRTRRIPFGEYVLPDDEPPSVHNIEAGIHTTLLIGPGLRLEGLPPALTATLARAVGENRLRILDLADRGFGTRKVSLVSRELRPRHLLHLTELQMQTELREGYIDDSFWSHVETLQTVDHMPDRIVDYRPLQDPAFRIARNHERADSYDEVFGPTCAFYWLRARYRGVGSPEALRTAAWLRGRLPDHDPHERALAYLMFATMGELTSGEARDLADMVAGLDLTALSETEILLFLRATIASGSPPDLVAALADALMGRQREGIWVDLTTTASAANALLDAHALLAGAGHLDVRERVERSGLAAVSHILTVLAQAQATPETHPYPWDGKARTTTKCLQAWLKFDALQDLPVSEMLDMLQQADRAATSSASSRTALGVLQAATAENAQLRLEQDRLSQHAARAGRAAASAAGRLRRGLVALVGAAVVVYVLLTLLVGALIGSQGAFDRAVVVGFVEGWQVHATVAGLVVAVVSLEVALRHRRRGTASDDEVAAGPAVDSA